MLLAIRERIMGVVGWFILGILFVAFAFFGLNSYLESSAENYAAVVNDQEVDIQQQQRLYLRLRARIAESLGDNYDPALLNEERIKATALQQIISEMVLLQAAEADGYSASNQLVALSLNANNTFKENGVFSNELYERILGYQSISPLQYEDSLKQEILTSQYRSGILSTAAATQEGLDGAFLLEGQKRKFSYIVLPLQSVAEKTEITDSEIKDYFEAHLDSFMTPERVRVEYLELDSSLIETGTEVDEQAVQDLYDEQPDKYVTAEERHARHILISLKPDADGAAINLALETAQSVITRLEAGESFDDLAKELSDDPGSASNGGDLGFFGRGLMAPEFETATFELLSGGRSQPVKTAFGFHVIELIEIKPEAAVPLEDVRNELVTQLQAEERGNLYYEQFEELSSLTFEQPDSLQAAADALDLEISTSDWIDKGGGDDVTGKPAVVEAAFSEDVLLNGNNSAPIEVDNDHVVVIRVVEHQKAAQQALDDVRDKVKELALDAKARMATDAKGSELLGSLTSEKMTLESIAAANKLELEKTDLITRNIFTPTREIVTYVFSMAPPLTDAASYEGRQIANGDYVIIALEQVEQGSLSDMPEAARQQAWKALSKLQGEAELAAALAALREQAIIHIPESSDAQ